MNMTGELGPHGLLVKRSFSMGEKSDLGKKVRVLFVAPYGGVPGGISRWAGHVLDYYSNCGKSDCDLTLVPMGRSSFININSPRIYRLVEALKDYSIIIRDFNKKLKNASFDVMHLTSSASWSLLKDIYMIKVARRKGLKTIIHFHFGRIPELSKTNKLEWKLIKRVLKLVDCAIVLDKKTLSVLQELGYKSVSCLPNPVSPLVRMIASQSTVRRIPRSILYCGHVVKTKGVFELIEACSHITGITVKMVGYVTDEMRKSIDDSANSADWLEVVGELPYTDVIKEMMATDILVLPSYTEGFPNVILEGMETGCAIVATDVGAIPQILEEERGEKYGVIVKPCDIDGLEAAINYLLNNPEEKEAIRCRAIARVEERYSMETIWRDLVSIWREALPIIINVNH